MTTYPHASGFVRHSDTSAESARLLDESGNAGSYDSRIMAELDRLGMTGATAEEMRKYLNAWFPYVHNGTINGRMSTLWRRREIVKLKECRITDSGKRAHVYVHDRLRQDAHNAGLSEPEYAQVTRGDDNAARQMAQMLFDMLKLERDGGASVKLAPLDLAIVESLAVQAGLKK